MTKKGFGSKICGFGKPKPNKKRNLFRKGSQVKTFKDLTHSSLYRNIVSRLVKYYKIVYELESKELIDYYINFAVKEETHRGTLQTAKLLKNFNSLAIRYSISHKFDKIAFRKCDSEGFPQFGRPFKKLLRGDLNEKRLALSILQIYKLITTFNEDFSVDSITKPGVIPLRSTPRLDKESYLDRISDTLEGDDKKFVKSFSRSWKKILRREFPKKRLEKRREQVSSNTTYHISGSNGPNGPSLLSIPGDLKALKADGVLWTEIENWFKLIGKEDLLCEIVETVDCSEINQWDHTVHTSKLSLKQESGGKNRIFAIGDYFTQTAMSGLHRWMMNYLSSLPEDGTFDQNRLSEIALKWTKENSNPSSTDLTTATDRIPYEMEAEIVSCILGEEFGESWVKLMTCRKFYFKEDDTTYQYQQGQPMGFLSSWASMAIWHHLILKTIYDMLHLSYKGIGIEVEYMILGDDNSKLNKLVSELYYRIFNLLKIPISKLKSISDETSNDPKLVKPAVEIAKRVFQDGYEITPPSPDLILNGLSNSSSFPDLLMTLYHRGHYINDRCVAFKLSRLCYNPRDSFNLATFPLNPAPYTGVAEYKVGSVGYEILRKSFWYKDKISMNQLEVDILEQASKQYIVIEVGRSQQDFFERVNKISNPASIKYGFGKKSKDYYEEIAKQTKMNGSLIDTFIPKILNLIGGHLIYKWMTESGLFNSTRFDPMGEASGIDVADMALTSSVKSLGFKSALKEALSINQILFDVKTLIEPKDFNRFKDKRDRRNKFLLDMTKFLST